MQKELLCYAIIPMKSNKEFKATKLNDTNLVTPNSEFLIISDVESTFNRMEDCSDMLIITNSVDVTLLGRIKFCWKFLFNYK